MAKLHVEIVTPEDKYFEGDAYMVCVPGAEGDMGFLPGHVSLVTPLGSGKVTISDTASSSDQSAKFFEIEGGYCEVSNDNIVILAEHVESRE